MLEFSSFSMFKNTLLFVSTTLAYPFVLQPEASAIQMTRKKRLIFPHETLSPPPITEAGVMLMSAV